MCNAFYQCSNGIWWDKQFCPDGLLFNPEISVCDWPENVECKEPEQNPAKCYFSCRKAGGKIFECGKKCFSDEPTVEPEPEKCADGIYPHETECNKYFQCSHGHRWEDQECPEGLLFNPEISVCAWPENVDCGNGNTGNPDCGESGEGIFPVPEECNAFYQCANGHR